MQKLFLASLFKEVAHQFAEFAGEPLAGKRGVYSHRDAAAGSHPQFSGHFGHGNRKTDCTVMI